MTDKIHWFLKKNKNIADTADRKIPLKGNISLRCAAADVQNVYVHGLERAMKKKNVKKI